MSEAILRALESDTMDPSRAASWLTIVVINICVDQSRDRSVSRAEKRRRFTAEHQLAELATDEVDERLTAAALAGLLRDELPSSYYDVLRRRAAPQSVTEIARALALSPKATESLLTRARGVARALVAASAAVAAIGRVCAKRLPLVAPAALAACVAVVIVGVPQLSAPYKVARLPRHTERMAAPVSAPSVPAVGAGHANGSPTARVETNRRVVRRVSEQVVLTRRQVAAGPATVRDAGLTRRHPRQSVLQSVQSCLDNGVTVTATYVGCR